MNEALITYCYHLTQNEIEQNNVEKHFVTKGVVFSSQTFRYGKIIQLQKNLKML